ncbi:hypothetical protein D3C73_1141920 [compost metagenome]
MEHHAEQSDGRNRRQRDRQIDAEQGAEMVRPVDQCRFLQLLRYSAEEVEHQDNQEGVDRSRQHQNPEGVHQPELLDNDIERDHPAVEHHGEDKQPGIDRPAFKRRVLLGQRIRRQERNQQCQPGTDDRPHYGDPDGVEKHGIVDRLFVSFHRELLRPQADQIGIGRRLGAE